MPDPHSVKLCSISAQIFYSEVSEHFLKNVQYTGISDNEIPIIFRYSYHSIAFLNLLLQSKPATLIWLIGTALKGK